MLFGLFCTYENGQSNYSAAYSEQTELAILIERLGYDEAWIAEHHFNPQAASPAPLMIIAHLAGLTTRLRLGSAAVLLPFCDPILIAEQVATVDLLSRGRFNLGVAKGGPFPHQFRHFHMEPEAARDRAREALVLLERLLYEDHVSFDGSHFKTMDMTIAPKPAQSPVPTFVATSTVDTIALAAQKGHGIMAGPPFPLTQIRSSLNRYFETAAQAASPLVLMRFLHVADSRQRAIGEAREYLRPFVERMRANTATLQPEWTPWMEIDRIIEDSLIGSQADVLDKMAHINTMLNPRSLVLKPLAPSLDERKDALHFFAEAVVKKA
jgi:alkanesulfonate monooxygenase SsuD/methylene tetrahydromethanopterin reductase-like flavin-dependent oxidoreductase (luciferase family)